MGGGWRVEGEEPGIITFLKCLHILTLAFITLWVWQPAWCFWCYVMIVSVICMRFSCVNLCVHVCMNLMQSWLVCILRRCFNIIPVILCFRLLSMSVSRYAFFFRNMSMMHLRCRFFVCVFLFVSLLMGEGSFFVVVCLGFFIHLYCSVQLSIYNMEKHYRNKIIIINSVHDKAQTVEIVQPPVFDTWVIFFTSDLDNIHKISEHHLFTVGSCNSTVAFFSWIHICLTYQCSVLKWKAVHDCRQTKEWKQNWDCNLHTHTHTHTHTHMPTAPIRSPWHTCTLVHVITLSHTNTHTHTRHPSCPPPPPNHTHTHTYAHIIHHTHTHWNTHDSANLYSQQDMSVRGLVKYCAQGEGTLTG